MTFNSPDFLFFFFPVLLGFLALPSRARTPFLLLASCIFYAYWSINFLCLLLALRGFDFLVVKRMAAASDFSRRRLYFALSLTANLGAFFVFKYLGFFSDTISALVGHSIIHFDLILPLGISFYTFHALSYVFDVYDERMEAETDFVTYCTYVTFFPQLVAGPIARARRLMPQFHREKHLLWENLVAGSYLIAKGYFMKVVIADSLGGYVDARLSFVETHHPLAVLQAVYFYALQVYCDFGGYSNIARGVAKCFDFDLDVNFRAPYFSASLTEFWQRWHISLTSWFRDYLFYPLTLSLGRRSRHLKHASLLILFTLSGLWHGASWTFVFWGALHGTYLTIGRFFAPKKVGRWIAEQVPRSLQILFTFHFIVFACVFFRAPTFAVARAIFIRISLLAFHPLSQFEISVIYPKFVVLALLFLGFEWWEEKAELYQRFCRAAWPIRAAALYAAIVAIALLSEINPKTFLYLQF